MFFDWCPNIYESNIFYRKTVKVHNKNESADGEDNDSGYMKPFPHIQPDFPGALVSVEKDL